eukprot:TRINITY_DN9753_c0_g2_i1.p1 TRINITY_DN9753_c0_g2~~TRINITY_DN9753_c0_g2_i1.p1  ORF type:complete len:237 (-),score=8.57 TRINITY_DN9753_c0_g2_i1:322-1032(-)
MEGNHRPSWLVGLKQPPNAIDRAASAPEFYRSRPPNETTLVIASGGDTGTGVTEADVIHELLLENGVSRSSIVLERKSKSTWANAAETLQICQQRSVTRIFVVTSDFHVARACFMFLPVASHLTIPTAYLSVIGAEGLCRQTVGTSVHSSDGMTWAERLREERLRLRDVQCMTRGLQMSVPGASDAVLPRDLLDAAARSVEMLLEAAACSEGTGDVSSAAGEALHSPPSAVPEVVR